MNDTTKGYLWLFFTVTIFSTYEVVGRLFAEDIHPLWVNAIRFSIGGLVLLPLALKNIREQELSLHARDFLALFGLGFLNAGVCMSLMQYSLRYTEASTAAVLISSNPLFVSLLSIFIFKEPLTKEKIAALLLGIAGMILVAGGIQAESNLGPILATAASVVWAIYTVAGKRLSQRYGSLVSNSLSFLLGGGFLAILSLALHLPLTGIQGNNLLLLVYLGVVVTGIGYYAFFTGLLYLDTTIGAAVFFFKPVLATLFAFLLLGEPITTNKIAGTMVILAAMGLVMPPMKKAARRLLGITSNS
ncbi:MAG: EamA family transporter [Firmicutes bacterium]|nr:EamA family transporter [Bacillota bacterium]